MSRALGEKPGLGAIVCAILLPPLGVWLAEGVGMIFLISLVLTCLGYIPGMIFSLVAVLAPHVLDGVRGTRA
jgi:uncharacterized membrane protein YqaE (UPF0057 family)